jgi:hypothetical protein
MDRVKTWAPSARQIKAALELIEPASKNHRRCKLAIVGALENVEFNKIMSGPPAAHKRQFNKFAKQLRAIEVSEIRYYARQALMDEVRLLREWFGRTGDKIKPRHGSPRLSAAKRCATQCAYSLLATFGKRPPGLTRGGTWHNLATTLYGDDQADLFDYLRRFAKASKS